MARRGQVPRFHTLLVRVAQVDKKIPMRVAGTYRNGAPRQQETRRGGRSGGRSGHDGDATWKEKMFEGVATALGSVLILGTVGFSYQQYYKWITLRKIEKAFAVGYSAPEMAALNRHMSSDGEVEDENWIARGEQRLIDAIIDGTNQGSYHLIVGEKGTGKTSMLLNAMRRIDGEGIALLEGTGDLEIFRHRLGKALNYEFHEDYVGGLFSFKGPRDTTPLLDIERALNKMEKVALARHLRGGKPLILVINHAHLLRNDDEGRSLLEVLQQRAELWSASRLVTVVFISDDHWIEDALRLQATRMRVLAVHDLSRDAVVPALRQLRARLYGENALGAGTSAADEAVLGRVYDAVGGRLRFLSQVARAKDMDEACASILDREKQWFLNQCWILGGEMDDNAEDQQDFSAAAFLLAKRLLELEDEDRKAAAEGAKAVKDGTQSASGSPPRTRSRRKRDPCGVDTLPAVPLHEARQIMTRPDFIQRHDHLNIFSIDSHNMVRADSAAMQNVFRDVCSQRGFEEHLQETLDRLDELESLGRTTELTLKEIVKGGTVQIRVEEEKIDGENGKIMTIKAVPPS